MPFPVAAALAAGGNIISQGINALTQKSLNSQTRRWNEKMYERQRQDNLAQWNLQNAYDSPAAQMQRYREAGLNPNLIYGQSNTSSPISKTEMKPWNPDAPRFNLGEAVSEFNNTRLAQGQVNNIREQNEVLKADANLKQVQALKTVADTKTANFDLSQKDRLKDISYDLQQAMLNRQTEEIRKVIADRVFTEDGNKRAAMDLNIRTLQFLDSLKTSAQQRAKSNTEMRKMDAEIDNLIKTGKILELDRYIKDLNKNTNPNDPFYYRDAKKFFSSDTFKGILNDGKTLLELLKLPIWLR